MIVYNNRCDKRSAINVVANTSSTTALSSRPQIILPLELKIYLNQPTQPLKCNPFEY